MIEKVRAVGFSRELISLGITTQRDAHRGG
jgi:hypothetical protein